MMWVQGNLTTGNQSTEGLDEGRSSAESIVCGIVLTLLSLTAGIGNITVIFAVLKNSKLRDQVSNLLLVNLAVTDLLSSVLVMAVSVYLIFADLRDVEPILCQLQCAANYCLIIVSMVTLACISLDRYAAVLWPLRYNNVVTRRRVMALMCWPWIQGVLFAVAPVWMDWVHYDYWEAVCAIDWQEGGRQVQYYVIIACILCFLVPGGIMIFCYAHIIKQARQCHKHIHPMPKATSVSSNFRQALKTITSLLVVVLVFFVCMTPFCLTKLLKVVVSTDYIPGYVNLASSYLEYFASVANPFIYGIFRRDFRFAYRRVLWHLSCKMFNIAQGSFQESLETIKAPGRVSNYTMTMRKPENGEPATRDSPSPLRDSAEARLSPDALSKQSSRPCSVSSIHGQLTLSCDPPNALIEMHSLPDVRLDHREPTKESALVMHRLCLVTEYKNRRTKSAGAYSAPITPICNGTEKASNGVRGLMHAQTPVQVLSTFPEQPLERNHITNGHI